MALYTCSRARLGRMRSKRPKAMTPSLPSTASLFLWSHLRDHQRCFQRARLLAGHPLRKLNIVNPPMASTRLQVSMVCRASQTTSSSRPARLLALARPRIACLPVSAVAGYHLPELHHQAVRRPRLSRHNWIWLLSKVYDSGGRLLSRRLSRWFEPREGSLTT